jgi:hypothetical protein
MPITWTGATDTKGNPTREFDITRPGKRRVTGALWLPEVPSDTNTLMLFGHGASGDRYQAPICYLAQRFVAEAGIPVLSLDGPVHGLRQVGEGGRAAFFPEFQRQGCVDDMVEEWHLAIEAVQGLEEISAGKLAYFGLSMGSLFGIPLVGGRDDVTVATLGLVGTSGDLPHDNRDQLLASAARIACPVLFLMQLEDELFDRPGYLEPFDAIASVDKRLHANPGLHPEIPEEEINFAFDFLVSHIRGTARRRIVNPLAE